MVVTLLISINFGLWLFHGLPVKISFSQWVLIDLDVQQDVEYKTPWFDFSSHWWPWLPSVHPSVRVKTIRKTHCVQSFKTPLQPEASFWTYFMPTTWVKMWINAMKWLHNLCIVLMNTHGWWQCVSMVNELHGKADSDASKIHLSSSKSAKSANCTKAKIYCDNCLLHLLVYKCVCVSLYFALFPAVNEENCKRY